MVNGTCLDFLREAHFLSGGHFVSFEVFWLIKISIFIRELAH